MGGRPGHIPKPERCRKREALKGMPCVLVFGKIEGIANEVLRLPSGHVENPSEALEHFGSFDGSQDVIPDQIGQLLFCAAIEVRSLDDGISEDIQYPGIHPC